MIFYDNKIQGDLDGLFGFYRHRARLAKINALSRILQEFNEDSFNVVSFRQAVESFRSDDINAALFGGSQTKALIYKLEVYSRQAIALSLVNAKGQIEVVAEVPDNINHAL